jgi:xanthine/uracil permease
VLAADNILRIIPPWVFSVVVTLIGYWGERRWFSTDSAARPTDSIWNNLPTILITHLVFLAILPFIVLDFFQPMIPFTGARAGLAVGLAGFLFGLLPARVLDAHRTGWDHALWLMLVDALRLCGALTLIGSLLTT